MIQRFYGEHRFLSNFWPVDIKFEGLVYTSVENAYQAAKTINHEVRRQFTVLTPGQAKRKGRSLAVRGDWPRVRVEIMRHLVRKKFQFAQLRALLENTGDERLVEGNYWHDEFWGVDLTRRPPRGENQLGKILMEVRGELNGK